MQELCITPLGLQRLDPKLKLVQSTSEIQTVFRFRIQFYASPGHRKPNHVKSGQKCPDFEWSRLDRFIIKKIFFMTLIFEKKSRLVDHLKSGQNCSDFKWSKNKMAAIIWSPFCFYHLKSGQKSPDFEWLGLA
jgi:hypothetical protein